MNRNIVSRRNLLRSGVAAAATGCAFPTIIPSMAFGGTQAAPPSERVRLGHIGVGGRGTFLMRQAQGNPGIESVAVADCYRDRREAAAGAIGGKAYADFRELLDRKDIDGVIIATPDHWHVPMALMAAAAGKDTYVEKPLGLTIEQDLACHKAFLDQDRIFQYGTQQREAKHQKIGRELVRSGAIGDITAIEVQAPNGGAGGSSESAPIPENFAYDMWLGPAPRVPYAVDRCQPQGTYWIYDQSIGYLAGWGAHPLDILVWCYDGDQAGPFTVEGTGVVPEEGLYDTVYDWDMAIRMSDGVKISFRTGTDSTKFIGTKGRLELTRSSIRAFPTELLPAEIPANDHAANARQHIGVFADSIRSRQPASSPIEDAVRSDLMSQLCDIAVRTGEKITWDPAKQRIADSSDKAIAMTSRPMHEPWTL